MLKNKYISKKSIYLTGINQFKIEKKLKKIDKKQVLIKVDSCGICSSDLKFIFTGSRIKKYPIILGHEISGSIGKNEHIVFVENVKAAKNLRMIQIYAIILFLLVLILMVDFQITLISIRKFYLKFLILNIRVKQN